VNTSYFRGFPVNAERLRGSIDPTYNYAVTDKWLAAIKATMNKPLDEDFRVSTVGMDHTYALRKLENGFAFGLFGGVNLATHRTETNDISLGSVLTFGTEQTSLTLNPALDKTFGQNHVEGIALTYGWQAKHELQKGFAIGIEGFGTIQNLGRSPTLAEQPHRIGPVIYLERELSRGVSGGTSMKGLSIKDAKSSSSAVSAGSGAPPKLYMEAGVLFGLTEGTQDTVFKLKGGIEY
jgi:Putative MetA-pathway of phenol degradation